ncbi:hypothetical protein GCM10009738_70210 [Kitasatospora viridis]|uniref:recombination regulator RecX n=1 Tax=Kitasatospora viridis TaxID=281105 RepID=UPI00336D2D45
MRSERGPGAGERPDRSEWDVEAKGEEEGERPDWVVDGPRAGRRGAAGPAGGGPFDRAVEPAEPSAGRVRPVGQGSAGGGRTGGGRRVTEAAPGAPTVRPIGEWAAAERRPRRARAQPPEPAESPTADRGAAGWVAEAEAELAAESARSRGRRSARPARPVVDPQVEPVADWVAEAEAELGADSARSRRRRGGRAAAGEPRERAPQAETDPAARARDICLRLLTGTARTRKQLADALRKREIPDEVAEEVLSRFEEVGLIDDTAFAAAWVESRHAGRGLARRALARELRTRGVDGAVVEEAVARLDPDDEAAAARDLVDRKLRATTGLDRQVRIRRLVGVLARRGYAEGLAFRVVREALDAEGESTEELEEWAFDSSE